MEKQLTPEQIRKQFNERLNSHLNRALGALLPKGEFKFDMVFLATVALLSEREIEIQNRVLEARYTYEIMLKELAEMGFQNALDTHHVFHEMEGTGYIQVQEDDTLLATKALLNMSQLLDRVFPKMPGINLIAYLVQTVDEVVSGRKDLQPADRQLDQVLEMQAEAFSRSREKQKSKAPPTVRTNPSAVDSKKVRTEQEKDLGEEKKALLRRLQAASRSDTRASSQSTPRIISARNAPASGMVRKEAIKQEVPESPERKHAPKEAVLEKPTVSEQAESTPDPEEATEIEAVESPKTTESSPAAADVEEYLPSPLEEEKKEEKRPIHAGDDVPFAEEDIASRVAAFEENLAMTCPLCTKGKVEVRETSKGKHFYECSEEGCYFISWGKPYHLACPKCRNPFMIEVFASSGRPFLRCPRATCNYKQNLPGENGPFEIETQSNGHSVGEGASKLVGKPRKRVVRRRVVRRKK